MVYYRISVVFQSFFLLFKTRQAKYELSVREDESGRNCNYELTEFESVVQNGQNLQSVVQF